MIISRKKTKESNDKKQGDINSKIGRENNAAEETRKRQSV